MRYEFDRQLALLNTELIKMGGLCEEVISKSVKCLLDDDSNLKKEVIQTDKEIDRKEREIENLCTRLLLQQQPVARDLRTISSAMKMISDMERIGDQAADICEIAKYVSSTSLAKDVHIADMARSTIEMVTDSIDAFVKKDLTIAENVIKYDEVVDDLFDTVKKELIEEVRKNNENAEALIDLLMIAKYFERIGDHAENIADWVVYSISGKYVED